MLVNMTDPMTRFAKPNLSGVHFPGAYLLATIPVFAVLYVLLILPFLPDDSGSGRIENILFWPIAATIALVLFFRNWARVDRRLFRSWPIVSLIAYFVFAAASVLWAYSPNESFTRLVLQILVFVVVVLPYALPISLKHTISGVHCCYGIALVVSAFYILTVPPTPIGHTGYFLHKQELGFLASAGLILSAHELLQGGWKRLGGLVTIGLAIWIVLASGSKSALAYALIAMLSSWLMFLVCDKTRLTPAFIVAAIVVASLFVSNPIERIAYRLYGDPTLTGRTAIWGWTNYQISQKPWLGWGFHSYYFVPNSPQNAAPGFIRDMPSSHSGYQELNLETVRIGYWIFLIVIYSSLHLLEKVRRIAPARAWFYLSMELFVILINITDSDWFVLDPLWILYLFVIVEVVRFTLPSKASARPRASAQVEGYADGQRPAKPAKLGRAAF
jgi:exopolysaccharide production protein ExoQ